MLHPSVPSPWWLRHLPGSAASVRFFEEFLQPNHVRVLAVERMPWQVLQLAAADLAGNRIAGSIAAALFDDIDTAFETLIRQDSVGLASQRPLEREAFAVATHYGLSLDDALAAIVADRTGLPLLVADADIEAAYQPLADDRVTLRVRTVAEFFGQS